MKKIASILFLCILVFNFWGYRWVLTALEQKATTRLEKKLDAGAYDEGQLVEVKVPLNMPYYTDWSGYQPYYGQVELNGENYQYVKRKVVADTLYLLCIPHVEKNNIQLAKSDYFNVLNNIQHNGQQKNSQPPAIKLMLSEFLQHETLDCSSNTNSVSSLYMIKDINYPSQFDLSTPAQPPEC